MAESGLIMAYLDGLGPQAAPQAIGNLRADLKALATGDFKAAQRTLCRCGGHASQGWGADPHSSVVHPFTLT